MWKRPRASYEWFWRHQGLPEAQSLLRHWRKWALILGLPALAVIFAIGHDRVIQSAFVIVALAVFPMAIQIGLYLEHQLRQRWPQSYTLDGRGIVLRDQHIRWTHIEGATVEDHPDVPSVRRIVVRVRGLRYSKTVEYDPDNVDEAVILQTLSEHVHSRLLLRPAVGETEKQTLLRPTGLHAASDPNALLRPHVTDTPTR